MKTENHFEILYKFSMQPQDTSGPYWTINRTFVLDPILSEKPNEFNLLEIPPAQL
jgi:hypothetical protein